MPTWSAPLSAGSSTATRAISGSAPILGKEERKDNHDCEKRQEDTMRLENDALPLDRSVPAHLQATPAACESVQYNSLYRDD